MHSSRALGALALLGTTALLAACTGASDGGGSSDRLVIGTTDSIVSLDPAGAWDRGSFTPQNQIYQHLLSYEDGDTTPVPEAAEECGFDDPTTYRCSIAPGLTFSNGDELTASDVVFSFQRVVDIAADNGPSPLLANMESVAQDGEDVVFTLAVPDDQTWSYVLSSMAGPIVDEEVYPADELLEDADVIGSGPYAVESYEDGGLLLLAANEAYSGDAPVTSQVVLKPYTSSTNLRLDVENGGVDVAYRSLTATDVEDLRDDSDLQVVDGPGGSVRFLTFNVTTQPGGTPEQKLAIRQAVASLVDREELAEQVYRGTYAPAYSVVLDGQTGATEAFADAYGATPDPDAAAALLAAAGVPVPVALPIQYTSDHYGPDSAQEYALVKSQLEESGLFTVDLQSTEWTSYVTELVPESGYPAYQLGFFPDYPDPDNFLRAAYSSTGSSVANGYTSAEVDALIDTEATATDLGARTAAIQELQRVTAADAPIVPLLQGRETVVAASGVTGLEDTLDATYLFRFSALGK
ncbi:peptide ABC transporter substrate-binding protein [Rathayibacter caricis DSM 15933]|uniref:Peptide ABC transporter substrate-binding protein n=1 Tax=Rathayibacter caricis DSM 15933 TaxID=1328867 RepID=A0A2T4UQ71_9MICO|nr:ABC transporter substrate-binding protein [Rathayibacter caricis]PTL71678.1 peptide ABC transporter substrate-binding protein [Rathayibacter caricis DSM 15933]